MAKSPQDKEYENSATERSDDNINFVAGRPQKRFKYILIAAAVSVFILVCLILNLNVKTNPSTNFIEKNPTSTPKDEQDKIVQALCKAQNYVPHPKTQERRKIYDLFMVSTELELLDIRLGQMYDEVDYFVILESPTTFTGAVKTLSVLENWDRWKPYHDKMIRHTLELEGTNFKNTWEHEYFQRNAMYDQVVPKLTGKQKINMGDVILVSDLDELIRNEVLVTLRYCDFPKKLTLGSQFFYYSYQFLHRGVEWFHPQATYYDGENTVSPQELRFEQNNNDRVLYHNAGWHCSYCFSKLDDLVEKLHSFSHQEFNKEEYTNRSKILHRVINGIDLFNRNNEYYDRIENNQDIPEFIKANRDKYKYMVDRSAPTGNFIDFVESDAALN